MLMPELRQLAGGLGIKPNGMKKAELVAAIRAAQSGNPSGNQPGNQADDREPLARRNERAPERDRAPDRARAQGAAQERPQSEAQDKPAEQPRQRRRPDRDDSAREDRPEDRAGDRADDRRDTGEGQGSRQRRDNQGGDQAKESQAKDNRPKDNQGRDTQGNQRRDDRGQQSQSSQQGQSNPQGQQSQSNPQNQAAQGGAANEEGSRRNRRRRGRDRTPGQGTPGGPSRGSRNDPDLNILEDDVLTPCAGILDVLDNYAFVRTSGYLPGSEDVYVAMSTVRKYGLRRGDAITGQVRQPREGERKEKFNPLVKVDSVNGADPESAKDRVEFSKLTPLYPSERLRLETTATNLIGRVIDIAAPIGKGQRGLIVSPAKAGKTMIMQSIANSITTNNPECHLMVVLVDERPEEVTDFERSVNGEVISSTFDRPASDHTLVSELAIERAKRLVELGHDVVVLLDGITRLGRAYNLAAPASGRILSGGVDSAALYPPKRFFGAARNIEDGGSLTILATALIESGSKMDEVIFEEFKGTGNMEIRLRRDFADKRIFPAIDAVQSGTRREELLMSKEELSIIWKLRRVLSGLDGQQALELLLERLKKSQNNLEFLMQVQKTTPTAGKED
ncbi:transcription termination factor Rho [Nocardioides terrisoli]|uniref:transcription termination factor Rho n=1 Tax=Nocardioides terrisoli TaxID=3388267 RepID=UPI00287B7ACB|nr:transcription termination factor Rho [Nocardioides marmorisolisilvae]